MKSQINSTYITIGIFIIFLLIIFLLPSRNKYEMFKIGQWKNSINEPKLKAGFCGPDFSKFKPQDNVSVRCIGDGNMTSKDCCNVRNMGQVCGVNLDNWEVYECKYYPGKACERCKTQNTQY